MLGPLFLLCEKSFATFRHCVLRSKINHLPSDFSEAEYSWPWPWVVKVTSLEFNTTKPENKNCTVVSFRGGSRINFLERGSICVKGWKVGFADFISFILNIPSKWNNLVSMRPNYFLFIGYLKTGGREGGPPEPPLDPPLSLKANYTLALWLSEEYTRKQGTKWHQIGVNPKYIYS